MEVGDERHSVGGGRHVGLASEKNQEGVREVGGQRTQG